MPISREEFDERHIDLTVPIAEVLESNPSLAFTAEEMLQELTELWARRATSAEVAVALETLVSAGQAGVFRFSEQRVVVTLKMRDSSFDTLRGCE